MYLIVFILTREHELVLGGHGIPAFFLDDRCYLEKCAAFSALGKLHVVRCSNYRIVDRLLAARGLSPLEHFLSDLERGGKSRNKGGDTGETRTRRNHIR
jgi:hypothetical protein